jgi:uncharacterized glyoxalase superfamily protein PhnB
MSENPFTASLHYQKPKAALDWLERAFGLELSMLIESPDDDSMLHAEMSYAGRGRVMVGGEWEARTRSPRSANGVNTQAMHLEVEQDIDAHCAKARAAGAVVVQEPEDQFYGARTYRALDLEGHMWTFSQFVRQVSRAEAEQAIGAKIVAKDWE